MPPARSAKFGEHTEEIQPPNEVYCPFRNLQRTVDQSVDDSSFRWPVIGIDSTDLAFSGAHDISLLRGVFLHAINDLFVVSDRRKPTTVNARGLVNHIDGQISRSKSWVRKLNRPPTGNRNREVQLTHTPLWLSVECEGKRLSSMLRGTPQ